MLSIDIEGLPSGSTLTIQYVVTNDDGDGEIIVTTTNNIVIDATLLIFAMAKDESFRMAMITAIQGFAKPEMQRAFGLIP